MSDLSGWVVALVTVGLIVLSAFFVVIEFSLLGARRQRLEAVAATSRSARAALRGMNELTVMLAGAQLGITGCTFALGAVTKPAVHYAMTPAFQNLGLAPWAADAVAFGLALLLVTFLHLVVGEMAPKSWAIAHPETSAKVIGIPARGFILVFRPLLEWVNEIANRLVARTGVTPVEQAAAGGQDAATIRQLVEHSAQVGVLETEFQTQIFEAIELEDLTVETLVRTDVPPTSVTVDGTVGEVRAAALRSGHMRILVENPTGVPGVLHVRDALLEPADRPARELQREPLQLAADAKVHDALEQMRSTSTQFAVVMRAGRMVGVVTMSDVLQRLLRRRRSGSSA